MKINYLTYYNKVYKMPLFFFLNYFLQMTAIYS